MSSKFTLLLGVAMSAGALAGSPLAADRPYLKDLPEKKEINVTEFEYPFLISQTALLSPLGAAEAIARVDKHLRTASVDIGAHGKDGKFVGTLKLEAIALPKETTTGDQLEAIQECKSEKCQMKLNDAEKASVEKAANKQSEYQRLIRERVKQYLTENKIGGYEGRTNNEETVRKMIGTWPFLSGKYPEIARYFSDGFWKKAALPKTFLSAVVKQELIPFGLERLQPIYRIDELFAFDESPGRAYLEMHVYSNHYFDASLRLWEILPAGAKSQVIVTDIMEIDELTKSGFIRMLFQGEMESAVRKYQHEELAGIAGLVSARIAPAESARYAILNP